jgi:hypothetical protein
MSVTEVTAQDALKDEWDADRLNLIRPRTGTVSVRLPGSRYTWSLCHRRLSAWRVRRTATHGQQKTQSISWLRAVYYWHGRLSESHSGHATIDSTANVCQVAASSRRTLEEWYSRVNSFPILVVSWPKCQWAVTRKDDLSLINNRTPYDYTLRNKVMIQRSSACEIFT